MNRRFRAPACRRCWSWLALLLLAACASTARQANEPNPVEAPVPVHSTQPPPEPVVIPPPRIALVLGGGAAKGFAHIGVIKALESHGVKPDILAGTSVGSLVAALYAAGYDGFALQRMALELKESIVSDWSLPDRGFFRGEALQEYVNRNVQNRPIEKLPRKLAIVATDLQSGQQVVFERGDTGMAVRASSSVPGVFQPVKINGRDYVDGGLVSPVPVRVARALGADIVIAVDISTRPGDRPVRDTIDLLLRTFMIMGNAIADSELPQADVVVKPNVNQLSATDFQGR
ncbi:MAG TPA: patatin-like phospholipase family protein, partial [Burkholderiales bacterium]|nr:patatin-like phospholipase family protein [Burkholderiales bacterium]